MYPEVPLFKPAKARTKLPDPIPSHYVAEEKMNGNRRILYAMRDPQLDLQGPPHTSFLAVRPNVKDEYANKAQQAPHITGKLGALPAGTVLDGEVTLPGHDLGTVNGIMNSSPHEAIQKQIDLGNVIYTVFDCLAWAGEPLINRPQRERYEHAERGVKAMGNPYVYLIEQRSATQAPFWFNQIVSGGGEGLIIKDPFALYGKGWAKMKKAVDISCVISGYKEGEGKYEGQIGALALSVWIDSQLTEVGFASGMDDALRLEISNNREAFLGRVVDVYIQEASKHGRVMHPTFWRFRDDLESHHCTWEAVEYAIKNKFKGQRERD